MLSRVKKNDTVFILSGKDQGKRNLVIAVYPKNDTVLVKDINIIVRHKKPTNKGKQGEIIREERPIPLSKVMPVCSACNKPCRVTAKVVNADHKVRVCHHCQESF